MLFGLYLGAESVDEVWTVGGPFFVWVDIGEGSFLLVFGGLALWAGRGLGDSFECR